MPTLQVPEGRAPTTGATLPSLESTHRMITNQNNIFTLKQMQTYYRGMQNPHEFLRLKNETSKKLCVCVCECERGTVCTSSTQIRGELSFSQAFRGAG